MAWRNATPAAMNRRLLGNDGDIAGTVAAVLIIAGVIVLAGRRAY